MDYFEEVERLKAGTPRTLPLSAASLEKPTGLLAATLWLITLDENVWTVDGDDEEIFVIPPRAVTGGLKHLKALHSIFTGLGAVLRDPMQKIVALELSPMNIQRVKATLWDTLRRFAPPHSKLLDVTLRDCISNGLLPTLNALYRRMDSIPSSNDEQTFLAAAIERLKAILAGRDTGDDDLWDLSGSSWVNNYQKCLDLIQNPSRGFLLDGEAARLAAPEEGPAALGTTWLRSTLAETLADAIDFHLAVLNFSFLVVVLFSFLHGHRQAIVSSLIPREGVEDAIIQIVHDWNDGAVTDAVVKSSNKLILDHLGALEHYEDGVHVTV